MAAQPPVADSSPAAASAPRAGGAAVDEAQAASKAAPGAGRKARRARAKKKRVARIRAAKAQRAQRRQQAQTAVVADGAGGGGGDTGGGGLFASFFEQSLGGKAPGGAAAPAGATKRRRGQDGGAADRNGSHAAAGAGAGKRGRGGDAREPGKRGAPSAKAGKPRLSAEQAARVRQLNDLISAAGQRKDLSSAKTAFDTAVEEGIANEWSYGILLNTYVRCGDVAGAAGVLRDLKAKGLRASVVAYTTLIKGYCAEGNLRAADGLLREMEGEGGDGGKRRRVEGGKGARLRVAPNIRTGNTFLRGCLQVGAVAAAARALGRMRRVWGVEPDASSYEYIVQLLSQGLRLDEARALMDEARDAAAREAATAGGGAGAGAAADGEQQGENAALCISVARAAALVGDWKLCTRAVRRARAALASAAAGDIDADLEVPHKGRASGGKRAWRPGKALSGSGGDGDAARGRSRAMFLEHRSAELTVEAVALDTFMQQMKEEHGGGKAARAAAVKATGEALRRLLVFPSPGSHIGDDGDSDDDDDDDALPRFAQLLEQRFGLGEWGRRAGEDALREARAHMDSLLDDSGHVQLDRAFGASLPRKLEVCSGTGEWVVAQALADRGRAQWASLELRADRVYKTLCRAVLEGATNLCVMAGDASRVLQRHVAPRSFECVFVNHPEPPLQAAELSRADPSADVGAHLLTPAFFESMARVLAPGGRLTVVTDNEWYARCLLRIAADVREPKGLLKPRFRSVDAAAKGADGRDARAYETLRGLTLYEGQPGEASGRSAAAQSYFHRLKLRESRRARYFLCLTHA